MGAEPFTIYEMSINYRIELQAHSLSNSGSSSVRLLPRRQLLADGTEVDAVSGNIAKYYHAELLAEYFEVMGLSLCPACTARDGRRAAALIGQPGYEKMGIEGILQECALCDAHGFLVTAKNLKTEDSEGEGQAEETVDWPVRKTGKSSKGKKAPVKLRQRLSKHSLIEYTFGLALPDHQAESSQLFTRTGEDEGAQMLFKRSARSGRYGMCIRYKCMGVGVDTDKWKPIVADEAERIQRHRAILSALRDCILSPSGAVTATMLPHLTGLVGAIVVQREVGRAPLYSPLEADFVSRLAAMASGTRQVLTFDSVDQFSALMDELIETSQPYSPLPKRQSSLTREE